MRKDIEVKKDQTPQQQSSFGLFPEFERMAERFFEDRFPSLFGDWPTFSRNAMTKLREEDDAYILSADIPGIPREDIEVNVSGNMLTIHAEHNKETGDESSGREYSREYRTFHQSLTLPTNVDTDQVEAHCENGRLEVLLPKTDVGPQRKIEIQSGKDKFQNRRSGKSGSSEKNVENKKH